MRRGVGLGAGGSRLAEDRRSPGGSLVRGGLAVMLSLSLGCGMVHTETRVEHGPVVGREVRESVPVHGALLGHLEAHWPKLLVRVQRADVCRAETVEASLEETITDKTVPGAGPALGMGITQLAVGGGLLLARGLFSNAPNTTDIDAGGHYGVPPRQVATTWGIALAATSIPALAVGIAGMLLSGEQTSSRRVETVVNAQDSVCHPLPAQGALTFDHVPGAATFPLQDGVASLDAELLRGMPAAGFSVGEAAVKLSDDDLETLASIRSCLQVTPVPGARELAAMDVATLQGLHASARACAKVPGSPGAAAEAALEGELDARPAEPVRERLHVPGLRSYEDALHAYPPKLTIRPGTPEAARLADTESLTGDAVEVSGVWGRPLAPGVYLLDVGELAVLVAVDDAPAWLSSISPGDRVELVAVVMGRERVKELEAPLLRAVWGRPAL